MGKVLITGGLGDVGYYLAKQLAEAGHSILIADNMSRGKRDGYVDELLAAHDVSLLAGDLCQQDFVSRLPLDFEYIYHLAATNGTDNFYSMPFTVLENCTLPTINLLRHFAGSKTLRRFVYTGSSESYSSTVARFNWQVPTDESVPLCIDNPANVRWSYGASKLHGEIAAYAAAAQFGIPVSIIRLHNVYAPRAGDKHVIPDFITRAENGIYELYGYQDIRSFMFVTDAVAACRLVAETPAAENEIFHVGSEMGITMLELGQLILKMMGKEGQKITCHESPRGSVPRRTPSIKKLRELTGFAPKVSLEKGISLVLAERRKNVASGNVKAAEREI